MARPRILSIPPGVRFLPTFVRALLAGEIVAGVSRDAGPFALADTTIYVPTRRAARALLAEFAAAADGAATLLPKIRPLGAPDEEAALFSDPHDSDGALDLDLPDAIGEVERRFILAELVLAWSRAVRGAIVRAGADGALVTDETQALVVGATPADAFALAGDLAALIDEFIVEGAPWDAVRHLAADDYDGYWGITTRFLRIAIEQWPLILQARDRIDAVDRSARMIEREIARLASGGARGPMIVLGSTGTNSATARLMGAIAALDNGAVVLPGLDTTMPDRDWLIVAGLVDDKRQPSFGHPQAALARLLDRLGVARAEVRNLSKPAPELEQRRRFVATAMAPSEATAEWRRYRDGRDAEIAAALAGVTLIEAADEREEALAIAIRLRGALETPGMTAALVTPDRGVARRVAAELARWGLEIDDSGGEQLGVTPAGVFARAALTAAAESSDVALVALLAHGAVAPAHERARTQALARMLEIGVLRATAHDEDWPRRILAAREAAKGRHAHPAARRIADDDWRAIDALAQALHAALAPLQGVATQTIGGWIAAHRRALALLGGQAAREAGDDDLAIEALFEEVAALDRDGAPTMRLQLDEYVRLFDSLAAAASVRGPQRSHARLKILGLLEARLLDADLVVLAGLDETIWPPQPKTDAFLNRPMRAQIGLTPPERRIGQSAHDFCMALGAPEVVLTRAQKRGGAPTVASRFLQRLSALADRHFDAVRVRGADWRALAQAIDRPIAPQSPAQRPEPKPAVALRPTSLSVTRIETLRRDPYAVYAQSILKLAAVGPLDGAPDASDQGSGVHRALHRLATLWPSGPLPSNARETLLDAMEEELAVFADDPTWRAFRRPRLIEGLDFVLRYEHARRAALKQVHGEVKGRTTFPLSDGSSFTLSAEADRIEIDNDGKARIVDYKTGVAPSAKQAKAGFASQLTLEARMLARGAFEEIGTFEAESGLYLKLGGKDGGKIVDPTPKGSTFADLAVDHWAKLEAMLAEFRDPTRGYTSRPYVQFASGYSDYDHLARVKEWSTAGEGSEGGA